MCCSFKLQPSNELSEPQDPVIFHNLKGYDGKHLISGLTRMSASSDHPELKVLATNAEQFKSLTLGHLRFVDSFQHLSSSLDGLVKTLLTDCRDRTDDNINFTLARQKFAHLASRFGHLPNETFALLLRKECFPYSWLDDPKKLRSKELPAKKDFFDDLNQEDIPDQEYEHAQRVWRAFRMSCFQDYLNLYLETDVLLLADVVANYRKISMEGYELDPLWYLSAPSLTFSAALKKTGVTLDLITDIDMFNMLHRSIRGGFSCVMQRRVVANLPGLKTFNKDQPQTHILYLDANNLYGFAQMAPLPHGGFQWITPEAFNEKLDLILKGSQTFEEQLSRVEASRINFFLEVDAEFGEEIHDYMKDLPFLPETIKPPGGKYAKLIAHLAPHKRYVLSLEMFLLAKAEGVDFPVIHRVLQFQQFKWLASYIQLNTDLRTATKDPFKQDYYKLMNNSMYGKCLQDVFKYVNFELFTPQNVKRYIKLNIRKPYMVKRKMVYRRCSGHEEDPEAVSCQQDHGCVVGLEMRKWKAILNRPNYVGFKILELSKLHMYWFFYRVLKPHFGDRVQLAYTDTDSFVLHVQSVDINQDLAAIRHHMDFSNLAPDHPLYDPSNKKVPGKFKLEHPEKRLTKFVGLRSKCYCIEGEDGNVVKRAKGTKKNVVKKTLDIEAYEACLDEQKTIHRTQHSLRSRNQQVFTIKQTKVALSALDDKRYLVPNSDTTLPWGHKDSVLPEQLNGADTFSV